MSERNVLVWFRNDLRLADNAAWTAASEQQRPVAAVYLFSEAQLRERHDVGAPRLDFTYRNLECLRAELAEMQVPLLCLDADWFSAVPDCLARLCAALNIGEVHCNAEYGWNERERDAEVDTALEELGVSLHRHTDQVLLEPGRVCKADGGFYQVFTPFRRAWLQTLGTMDYAVREAQPVRPLVLDSRVDGLLDPDAYHQRVTAHAGASSDSLFPAGETEAQRRLQHFAESCIEDYQRNRDFPACAGTSGLSAYLSAGIISPRACLRTAKSLNHDELDTGQQGITTWITELVWREFYRHVLVGFPWVNKKLPFRPETSRVPWRQDEAEFQRWCEGRTGYPIVDAAQRQLNETGWMHNRLRMITAMFLSKHLLIDWRWGERYFMQKLVDGDFASNNGGWQWSASTGTDAAPYFRIFNPVTQSERFDPQGDFIRKFVPELQDRKGKAIHQPLEKPDLLTGDYPAAVVDHKFARERALAAFKNS